MGIRQPLLIFAVAVLLNYPWELAQAPLYVGLGDFRVALWHCFLSSLGASGYLVMLTVGLTVSVGIEWVAVHLAQRWTYTEYMPRVPGIEVGIVPVAQMLILPPLIFRMVCAMQRKWTRIEP